MTPQISSDSNQENCLDRSKIEDQKIIQRESPKYAAKRTEFSIRCEYFVGRVRPVYRFHPTIKRCMTLSMKIQSNLSCLFRYEQRKLSLPIPSPRLFDVSQRISTPTPIQNPSSSPSIHSQSSTSTTDKADRLLPKYGEYC